MTSDLGMEPYAVVPYNPHQERPYNSFKDELQNNALMSSALTYPDPNEEFWETINTLPQLANDANVSSHDEFAPAPSVSHSYVTSSHRGANPVAARASASTTTRSSDHINAEPVPAHASHILHSPAPKEARLLTFELHLCKTCCAAVQALISYGTTIHLVRATCSICHGTSSSTTINLDGTEHSHFRAAATPTSTPQRPTIHRSPNTKNRVAKQKHKRNRSLNHHSTVDRGGLFYCQSEGCNRSPGGRSFARKDNRDVHERTVHGVETGEDHEAD